MRRFKVESPPGPITMRTASPDSKPCAKPMSYSAMCIGEPPGGGEGRDEVGDSRALSRAHFTLPCRRRAILPLSPEGRRGSLTYAVIAAILILGVSLARADDTPMRADV